MKRYLISFFLRSVVSALTNTLQEWLQCPRTFLIRHFLTSLDTNLHFRVFTYVARPLDQLVTKHSKKQPWKKATLQWNPTCLAIFGFTTGPGLITLISVCLSPCTLMFLGKVLVLLSTKSKRCRGQLLNLLLKFLFLKP